jgi:hypothetical protein
MKYSITQIFGTEFDSIENESVTKSFSNKLLRLQDQDSFVKGFLQN